MFVLRKNHPLLCQCARYLIRPSSSAARRTYVYTQCRPKENRLGQLHQSHPSPIKLNLFSTKTHREANSKPDDFQRWRDLTKQLFKVPSSSKANHLKTSQLWHQAEQCLNYWCKQKELDTCLEILDHLALKKLSKKKLNTECHLNPVVKLWRYLLISDTSNAVLLPSKMSQKLRQYEQCALVKLDKATHGMILDAASQITHRDSKEGVLFADSYLKSWIETSTSEFKKNEELIIPDVVAVGSVVHAWLESDLPEAPRRADQWIDVCINKLQLEPSTKLYTSVIAAWAKVGNPSRAQRWMEKMIELNVEIDLITWNCLLFAWANSPLSRPDGKSPAQHAEMILKKMIRLYDTGNLEEAPDVISYSTVLDAWAKQVIKENNPKKKKEIAQNALRLLQQMKESENPNARPNTISYNSVLATCARAELVSQAELLMKEMIQEYKNHSNYLKTPSINPIQPNIQSFSLLILAYSKIGTIDSAEKAETALKESSSLLGIKPNLQSYSNCISCWARASSPHTTIPVERASILFRKISEDPNMTPDVVTYTALMNAWGRHGRAQEAHALLDDLWDIYQDALSSQREDAHRYKPSVQTLTTVLHAWSSCEPERAEALLKRMESDYKVAPNVYSFSVVLRAWAKNASSPKYSDAPDRAMMILNKMNDTEGIQPNVISYSTVIQAFAKQGRANEAEALLQEMLSSSSNNNSLPKPDAYCFSSVLFAWSRSKDPNAADRAEIILVRMHEMNQANELDQPPNVFCYTNVLSCLARSKKARSAHRALTILKAMQKEKNSSITPNLVSYNNVINAFANEIARESRTPNGAEARNGVESKIKQIFELLDEVAGQKTSQLQPDEFTFRAVVKAIKHLRTRRKMGYADRLLDIMRRQGFEPSAKLKHQISQLFR
jgi:pentatricopeptide repeat protein